MKEFLKDLFAWKGRWNRLKFWLYPMILIIPIFVLMTLISFMSLSGYTDQARETKVSSDLSVITSAVNMKSIMGDDINSFINEDNTINFNALQENKEYFKNPFSDTFGEYKIFVKDGMFQVYGETPSKIIIKGNYYQEDDSQPESLVIINGETKIAGIKEGVNKKNKNSNIFDIIGPIIIGILYILFVYISYAAYVKRLRDLDKNPWMSLLMFVPFANMYLLIVCGFFKGTVGPNKYGLDPLNPNMEKEKTIEL